MKRLLDAPETNVALFAFLLNLPWEFAQVPFFAGMPAAQHWSGILVCARATLGDVVIALAAFWAVALAAGGRTWVTAPTPRRTAGFVSAGVLITIAMERLATGVLARWTYAEAMPVVPVVDVGVTPLVQWMVIPPVMLWFVRRQLT